MTFSTITLEHKGTARWITLNRPNALNAFIPQMIVDIDSALSEIEADPDARVVVLTGAGRAFCAGGDLGFVEQGSNGTVDDPRTRLLVDLRDLLGRIERFPKPVIAAINGLALAGGLEFVLCCDLVIAAEEARIGDVHANYGLIPGGGASIRLVRKIGVNRAKYLLYTGVMLPASRFVEYGLVHEIVPLAELVATVDSLAGLLAEKSALALRRVKDLVHDGLEQPIGGALNLELLTSELHAQSDDVREGLEAFRQKRRPVFSGR
jgi:enoyl-CoA hydratase